MDPPRGTHTLINLCNEVTNPMCEWGPEDIVSLDFCKAFDAVPQKMPIEKLLEHGLDERMEKTKAVVLFACVIFMVFLIVEIGCAPKGKTIVRNWGPQSILYLKGRYGRRYTSEKDEQYYKLNLEDFRAFLKSCVQHR